MFEVQNIFHFQFQIFIKKRYRNRCGMCVTTPDSLKRSNGIYRCEDRTKLRISYTNAERIEMGCANGINNFRPICSDAQPKSFSSQHGSLIVKGKSF